VNEIDLSFVEGTDLDIDVLATGEAGVRLRENASIAACNEDARYFGLRASSPGSSAGTLGYYVGIGRFSEATDRILRVSARRFGEGGAPFAIDYASIYGICAAEPEVSQHLNRCLTIYPDEPPVAAHDEASWSPLIALAYINALHTLVQRHLRDGFTARYETLHGRVRGQIDVRRHITQSLAFRHPEAVPCRFQSLEPDTIENRILRTALLGATRILEQATGYNLHQPEAVWRPWARQAGTALMGVRTARIEPRDFHTARKTGAFRHYAQPLALARAVLTRVGFDPNRPPVDGKTTVQFVPFRLATAELFERYAEACLRFAMRALQNHAIWVGYHDNNLGKKFAIRPDFLVRAGYERLILDAKYKDLIRQTPHGAFRWDAYQVLSYSQHKDVQSWWSDRELPPSMIILCYPMRLRMTPDTGRGGPVNNASDLVKELVRAAARLASGSKETGQPDICCVTFNDFVIPVVQLGLAVPIQPGAGGVAEAT